MSAVALAKEDAVPSLHIHLRFDIQAERVAEGDQIAPTVLHDVMDNIGFQILVLMNNNIAKAGHFRHALR